MSTDRQNIRTIQGRRTFAFGNSGYALNFRRELTEISEISAEFGECVGVLFVNFCCWLWSVYCLI